MIFEDNSGLSVVAAVRHAVFIIKIVHYSVLNSLIRLAIVIKVAKEMLLP